MSRNTILENRPAVVKFVGKKEIVCSHGRTKRCLTKV